MTSTTRARAQFYDINKLPPEEGILVFPISMSRISNQGQNARAYWKFIQHFHPKKINKSTPTSKVGVVFIYGDFLYFYTEEKASDLKNKYMNLIAQHKNNFMKIVRQDDNIIPSAFSFKVWNQFYLDNEKFVFYFNKIKELYQKDKKFQKCVVDDYASLENNKKKLDENQVNFFLEEHLMFYLIAKGQMRLDNSFILGQEKWVLNCYPGKPLKAQIYLHQSNLLKLSNPKNNIYENCWYDLSEKKLYDFTKIDLEIYEY